MTNRSNLYVDQGIDFSAAVNLFTDTGNQFDITTQTFSCDVRKIYSSSVAFSANIVVEPDNANGVIEIVFPSNETANAEPGKYQYDVVMQSDTGTREKILEGLLFLLPTVTRGT